MFGVIADFAQAGTQRFFGVKDMDPSDHVYVVSLARRPSKRLKVPSVAKINEKIELK